MSTLLGEGHYLKPQFGNVGLSKLTRADVQRLFSHLAEAGRGIEVMVRGRGVEAVTIPIPFYKRAK